jgi:hypothetical protein
MKRPETELAAVLRERLAIIADDASRRNPEQHVAKLRAISERIASLREKLPRPLDPQLAHFLARCSYDKALARLEEQAAGGPA